MRHPFERVLSAYRNKLQDPYNALYQRAYGSQVLRMFRKNLTDAEYKVGQNVTFPEMRKTSKTDLKTLVKEYFSQFPKDMLKELYDIYEDDFKAFSYSTEDYF